MEQNINQFDILRELIAQGKITKGDAESIEMELRYKRILEMHQYAIFKGRDGRWNTHVPDATKPNGRRRVKKTKKEDLYDYLENYYSQKCRAGNPTKVTMRELYPLWMEHKLKTTSQVNCARISSTWKRYYEQSDIVDIPICKLDKLTLEEWIIPTIKGMDNKQYEKFNVIMKQLLEYAEDMNIVDRSPYRPLTKSQRRQTIIVLPKKKSEDMILSPEKLDEFMEMARDDIFNKVKKFELAPLVAMFMFGASLRVSEAVVVKNEDFAEGYVYVNRMFRRDENKVIPYTKMAKKGDPLPISTLAQDCIDYANQRSQELGIEPEYLFCIDGEPKSYYRSVSAAFEKYTSKLGFKMMTHTARRQCISALKNSHLLSDEDIREFARHAEIRTTNNSYTFSTSMRNEKDETIRNVVDSAIFHGVSPLSPRKTE